MVALLDTILKHLKNNGAYVDALFADIVRAFDSLDHNVVVEEAKALGARPFVGRMLASFLFERSQCVHLPDHEPSEFVNIFCGSPRGTKLGLLSFLLFLTVF